jgi:hypothetical protein
MEKDNIKAAMKSLMDRYGGIILFDCMIYHL